MNNKWKMNTVISWAAVLLWMLLIFNLSSQVAEQSDQLSRGLVKIVVEFIDKLLPGYDFDMDMFNHIIRKYAHFFAYLMLGILVVNALRRSGFRGIKVCVLAIGICVLYAVSDEVHQLFVPGRSGQARDVLIDSAGSAVGIGLYLTFGRIKGRVTGRTMKSTHIHI
ncbi:MAG TPA: VanZ family protein [Clostridia bacterium]|nr:VanZ family protein [Clostridia bacterium]